MPRDNDDPTVTARRLFEEALAAYGAGGPQRALDLLREALEVAEDGDQELRDRIFCNACSVALELGDRSCASSSELKRILMRTREPETAYLASYNAARRYELDRDLHHALFYAGIARDRAVHAERHDWLGYSYNLIANLQLADSDFGGACLHYELALEQMSSDPGVERALILDNLGYCRFVQGRHHEGFSLLFECLRTLRRFGAERFEARPRLSLSYGYLEAGRHDRALRHGERCLVLAEHHDDEETIKNAHFLLGEIHSQLGEEVPARRHFDWLQRRYCPEAPHLTDLLLAVDVCNLINLKA